MYDVLIEKGLLVDGTGTAPKTGDLAIQGDRIAAMGDLADAQARRRIEASGRVVAPGFIDTHSHSDISVIARPDSAPKIRQGVTTEVIGNCGFSPFPLSARTREMTRNYARPILGHPHVEWPWSTLGGYFQLLAENGTAVNVAALIGHGALRSAVLGFDDCLPTPAQLGQMQALLDQAMQDGAFGLSTGLCYAPGVYASTDELIALCRVVSDHRGLYATHLRNQSDLLVESVTEALSIGRAASVPVLVSHHKAAGRGNWGKVKDTLAMLDDANSSGVRTWSDVYPYVAGQSTMLSTLPPWAIDGGVEEMLKRLVDPVIQQKIKRDFATGLPGWENRAGAIGWENIIISSVGSAANKRLEGMSLGEAASRAGKEPVSFLMELLVEERGAVGRVSVQCCEADVETVLSHSRTMIGSDGLDVDNPHPREYGCFPRVLGEYVRERKTLSLERAIHKMTGLPAATFGFAEIGLLRPGLRADVVVFDPRAIRDVATFADPCRHPEGIDYVFVGGTAAVDKGRATGARNGMVLRHRRAGEA